LHLVQAIAAASAPGVVYMTAERFTHGIAYAVRYEKMEDFREHLAGAEMLVLDDVQDLRGKTVQQEFRRALYGLLDGQLPIMLAGDPLGAPVARRPAAGMEAAAMAAGFRADFDKPTGRLLIAGPGWPGLARHRHAGGVGGASPGDHARSDAPTTCDLRRPATAQIA
jgi:hypothetical protein